MNYQLRGLSLSAAIYLGRWAHPLRREVYGLEPVDFAAIDAADRLGPVPVAYNEPEEGNFWTASWDEWFTKVQILKPDADGPEGWGDCYGAGLTPDEAVACCNQGVHQEQVIGMWQAKPATRYELMFTVAGALVEPGNSQRAV